VRPIRIVTTTGMVTDIVQNVGGDRVEVKGLMGPGIDPHLYRASESNVRLLEQADLVLYSGLHLEAQMAHIFERMQARTPTVALADAIDPALRLTPPDFKGAPDPHVWFDVALWMRATERARDALIDLDPGSADAYRANAGRYLQELAALDAYVREQAARVPPGQRVLITAHDAFNYFGRAYGFDVTGLQGISTEAEASTADVQALTDLIVTRQIPAIFVESSVPQRTIEAVQAAVAARGFDVQIGGQLYSDAMGDPGTPEGTYIGMVRHNIDTIVGALVGAGEQTN
jgi:manganese/zinc/iron transport system substrate-binding protein